MAHVTTFTPVIPCSRGVAQLKQKCLRSAFRSGTKLTPRPVQRRPSRGIHKTPQAGFFDIFTGGSGLNSSPKKDGLVQELYEAVDGTQAGLIASSATRERITELVDQLTRYSVRSPTRSELLWGEWEIVYCSNPTAPGGPFRSAPGRALFANQRIRQSLQKPDTITNNVEFKTLGLLPGSSQVAGDLKILDGQRYEVNLGKPSVNVTGTAVASKPASGVSGTVRVFRTLYLDEFFRVAQFEPEDETREPVLFVFQRLSEEEEEEEQEEEEEDEVPVIASRSMRSTRRAAPEPVQEAAPASMRSLRGTRVLGRRGRQQQQEEVEVEEDEEEEEEPQQRGGLGGLFGGFGRAKQQADPEMSGLSSADNTNEDTGQERFDSRVEQQERRAALQEGIKEFADSAREATAEARQLSQILKVSEKETGRLQRGAAQERSRLEAARAAVEAAMAELEEAEEEEKAAGARAKESMAEIKELERASGGGRWW